jgi:hypothetical protein
MRAVKAMSDKRADRREEQHRREREHAAETGGAKDRPPAVIDDTGMVANEAFITEVESKPTDEEHDPFREHERDHPSPP